MNKAWFVNSDVVDQHILAVEDMYARYFEAGNHKVAVNKLRKATAVREYHGGAMFRNGLSLAAGLVCLAPRASLLLLICCCMVRRRSRSKRAICFRSVADSGCCQLTCIRYTEGTF